MTKNFITTAIASIAIASIVVIVLMIIAPQTDNSRDECRAANPGYECSLITRWEPSNRFGE